MCVFDFAPRRFPAQEQATLILIAELIASEIEKEEVTWAIMIPKI